MKFTKFGKALVVCAISVGVALGLTSCVQSYTVGFLYVTDTTTAQPAGHGNLDGFKVDHNTGNLVPIHGFPISSGGANPVRSVLISGSRFLYVLNRGANSSGGSVCTTEDPCRNANITQFAVGGNGILTPQPEVFFSKGTNPFRLLTDSSGNYLFVLDHDAPSSAACKLALGGSVTSCADVTVFQINQTTGRLQLVLNAQVTLPGGGALPYFPVPADPIDFTLTSGFLLTLAGTPDTGDFTFPYTYNSSNGQLTITQNSIQPLNIHQGTTIANSGGVIYVLDNEPITVGGKVVSQSQFLPYTIGSNGSLQIQSGGAVADDASQANPSQILVNRKASSSIWPIRATTTRPRGPRRAESPVTSCSPATFPLAELPGIQYGTGAGPQCIVEDPSDQFIYTANYDDSTVTGKVINVQTGTLQPLRKTSTFSLAGPATWCVMNGRTN